jgi:hypothetical protein
MFYLTIFTNWLQSKTASIAAQRFALPAVGRGADSVSKRNNVCMKYTVILAA